jgi:flagellin
MSFDINTNIASLQAQQYLRVNSDFQSKTINRVTSGLRIINSGDDAAGLAIANGYRSDQSVLTQGIRNANDGLSTLQTIDGGMNNISQLLDRARTLAAQSASGTFNGDRSLLDGEFQSVLQEINRQAQSIGMNSGGQFAKTLSVFIGGGRDATGNTSNAGAVAEGSVTVNLASSAVDTQSLGLTSYGTTGSVATLGTITAGTTGGAVDLKFYGAGYSTGVLVTALGVNNATSLAGVVAAINNGITTAVNTAGAPNAAFAANKVQAQLDSTGTKIQFVSANGAFAVTDKNGGNGAAAAANILGVATNVPVLAQGTQQIKLDQGTVLSGVLTQDLTFTATDSSGVLSQVTVSLVAGTKAAQVTAINTALQGAPAGSPLKNITALDSDAVALGSITLTGTGAFHVAIGVVAGSAGFTQTGGAVQGVINDSAVVGAGGALDVLTAADAKTAVTSLAAAVSNLGSAQAVVGKGQNTFNYAINLAQSQNTNLAAAESRIRDADLAAEAANLTKAQILLQAGTAAVAQANTSAQAVLALLKG